MVILLLPQGKLHCCQWPRDSQTGLSYNCKQYEEMLEAGGEAKILAGFTSADVGPEAKGKC